MQHYTSIDDLMSNWKMIHQRAGWPSFIIDGIVSKNIYHGLNLRICYILKECYLSDSEQQNDVRDSIEYRKNPESYPIGTHRWIKYITPNGLDFEYDLAENLKKEPNWYMWHKVEKMTEYIWDGFAPNHNLSDMGLDRINQTDYKKSNGEEKTDYKYTQTISVVNIKKSNGKPKSDLADILYYAKEDKNLILNEISLINPNVIVMGGTMEICRAAGLIDNEQLKEIAQFESRCPFKKAYEYNGIIIIEAIHPAFPYLSYKKLESSMDILNQINEEYRHIFK